MSNNLSSLQDVTVPQVSDHWIVRPCPYVTAPHRTRSAILVTKFAPRRLRGEGVAGVVPGCCGVGLTVARTNQSVG